MVPVADLLLVNILYQNIGVVPVADLLLDEKVNILYQKYRWNKDMCSRVLRKSYAL